MATLGDETGTPLRACNSCAKSFPFTLEFWPANGKREPKGGRCRICVSAEKKIFDRNAREKRVAARTQQAATLTENVPAPASAGAVSTSKDRLPGELPLRQLEVVKALREGAQFLNGVAKTTLDTLAYYLGDVTHPHHEWAIKFVADRLLPKKLYEDLGAKEAGVFRAGDGAASRPSVTIIVQPAAVPGPAEPIPTVQVIEGEAKRSEP